MQTMKKTGRQSDKNYRKALKKLALFLAFEVVFTAVSAPIIIFFGPFQNIKNTVVGSLYTTLSHQYMVTTFLSQQAIERIIGSDGYYSEEPLPENKEIKKLDFKVSHSDKIDFYKIEGGDLKGCLLVIHDPTRVKVGYSAKLPVEGETTSTIAKRNGAAAAINAGGFSYDSAWASTGGQFDGFIISGGVVVGNSLNSEDVACDTIGLTENGQLIFGKYSIKTLQSMNVKEAISFFGPQLIADGKKFFTSADTGGYGIAPRTAIGQKSTGEILFLVIDGRNVFGSLGASMYDLQEILYAQGAVNAINLDGGSSSTMYFDGKVVNKPSNSMGERTIPSVFMVIPEEGDGAN